MESIASKELWLFSDGTRAPAYVVTVIIPERWLRHVVDSEGADKAVEFLGRAVLEAIKGIEPEGVGRG